MDAIRLRGSPLACFAVIGGRNNGSESRSGTGSTGGVDGAGNAGGACGVMNVGITVNVKQEPLIVVEESNLPEEEQESSETYSNRASLDIDSPVNPYLLSPWRDPRESRKHSLPSQQVTEGITASQVRRLSERGGEGSGPTPKEAAFLATLSQAPAPSGRRHSVVTISKVPTTLFGRSRRESVAAYPTNSRVLSSRRESNAGPPSTDPIGSIHNLQLDIMDDIVQSRKARMTLWNSSSEKVCEVQTVDESGSNTPRRYSNRRYSECVQFGAAATPSSLPAASLYRRGSEYPSSISPQPPGSSRTSMKRKKSTAGLLGSRTDIATIFNTLTSSAIEIHKCGDTTPGSTGANGGGGSATASISPFVSQTFNAAVSSRGKPTTICPLAPTSGSANMLDPNVGRSIRSNSFDVSVLNNAKQLVSETQDNSSSTFSDWFAKRHEPIARKKSVRSNSTAMALSKDVLERLQRKDPLGSDAKPKLKPRSKQKTWAETTKANIVDATMIGSAIEGFLRKSSSAGMQTASNVATATGVSSSSGGGGGGDNKGAVPKDARASTRRNRTGSTSAHSQASRAVRSTLNWFSKGDEDDSKDTCDTSLCATLKDLFVK